MPARRLPPEARRRADFQDARDTDAHAMVTNQPRLIPVAVGYRRLFKAPEVAPFLSQSTLAY
jgi:hypothetical protein